MWYRLLDGKHLYGLTAVRVRRVQFQYLTLDLGVGKNVICVLLNFTTSNSTFAVLQEPCLLGELTEPYANVKLLEATPN